MPDALSAPGAPRGVGRRAILDTRFGQMHTRIAGQYFSLRRPPLVLLHMTPLSGAMYDLLMPLFATERLVVAPDRLGFGYSDWPYRALDMAEYAQATLDLLDALEVDRFDLLGTHTGSVEATELAWSQPERVRKVALVSIPAYTPQELEQRQYRLAGVPSPAEDGSHLAWHWQRRFLYREPPFDLPLFQWRLVQELLAAQQIGWAYKAVFEYPMAERLAALRQPVLVLAPHDDLWEQTDRVRHSKGLPPRAEFVDLPDLGLDITYFATDAVAELLRVFLDSTGD